LFDVRQAGVTEFHSEKTILASVGSQESSCEYKLPHCVSQFLCRRENEDCCKKNKRTWITKVIPERPTSKAFRRQDSTAMLSCVIMAEPTGNDTLELLVPRDAGRSELYSSILLRICSLPDTTSSSSRNTISCKSKPERCRSDDRLRAPLTHGKCPVKEK
jgi:hypothetical protein